MDINPWIHTGYTQGSSASRRSSSRSLVVVVVIVEAVVRAVVMDINPCLWWNQWIFAVDSSETCFVCLRNPRKQRSSFLLRVKEELFELLCFLLLDWHIL